MNRAITSRENAAAITRRASLQTYYTVRLLVDKELASMAFQAYAYFRWVDDRIDDELHDRSERMAFVERQKALMESCYHEQTPNDVAPQEYMLIELIQADPQRSGGLYAYIRSMMAVMAFDAERKGRVITRQELGAYTRNLATAVTEALHYFIGHRCCSPRGAARNLAAMGAHITHMLRDAFEDCEAGYYNVPRQVLTAHQFSPQDLDSPAYRAWVSEQVGLARACFQAGKDYLKHVESFRCRLAGHAYIARFEVLLDAIEREAFHLRPEYNERKCLSAGFRVLWAAMTRALAYKPTAKPMPRNTPRKAMQGDS